MTQTTCAYIRELEDFCKAEDLPAPEFKVTTITEGKRVQYFAMVRIGITKISTYPNGDETAEKARQRAVSRTLASYAAMLAAEAGASPVAGSVVSSVISGDSNTVKQATLIPSSVPTRAASEFFSSTSANNICYSSSNGYIFSASAPITPDIKPITTENNPLARADYLLSPPPSPTNRTPAPSIPHPSLNLDLSFLRDINNGLNIQKGFIIRMTKDGSLVLHVDGPGLKAYQDIQFETLPATKVCPLYDLSFINSESLKLSVSYFSYLVFQILKGRWYCCQSVDSVTRDVHYDRVIALSSTISHNKAMMKFPDLDETDMINVDTLFEFNNYTKIENIPSPVCIISVFKV